METVINQVVHLTTQEFKEKIFNYETNKEETFMFASCGIICFFILDIPKKRTFIFKFIVLVLSRKVKGKLEKGK